MTYWRVLVTYESPNELELTFVVQTEDRRDARSQGLVLGNKLGIPIADVTVQQIWCRPEREIPDRVVARSYRA